MWFNDLPAQLQPTLQSGVLPEDASQPGRPAWPVQAYARLNQSWLGVVVMEVTHLKKPDWLLFMRCCLGDWLIKLGTRLKGQVTVSASTVFLR